MNDPLHRILLLAVAILLPPLAVALKVGLTVHFWLSVALTLLGYIPGLLHALFITLQDDQ